jgi:release factor glutamine methyltransferase
MRAGGDTWAWPGIREPNGLLPQAALSDGRISCIVPITTHAEPWTTRRLLGWMTEAFTKSGLDSPRLCAELLLSHVLGCDRLRLYMDTDRRASELELSGLRALVARALKHEPVQYLVGEGWFFGLAFKVDRRVLVPRPSTETMVEHVLQSCRVEPGFGGAAGEGMTVLDVCTGSGCVAVALLKNLKGASALATDISGEALDVARQNASKHGVAERVEFVQGDLLGPVFDHPRGHDVHVLTANPPYIPDAEWDDVPENVRGFEPEGALRGGRDGLDYVRPLLERGPDVLRPGGMLLVETAASTAGACLAMASADERLRGAKVLKDHEGLERVVVARRV